MIAPLVAAAMLLVCAPLDESGWPREFEHPKAKIVMYQPQPESFEGNTIKARAAVSVTLAKGGEPVFGCVWMEARVEVDRTARTVDVVDVKVTRAHFPDSQEKHIAELKALLEDQLPKGRLPISLDALITTLDDAAKEKRERLRLKNDPPAIIVSKTPATLVTIDGEPELRPVESTGLMRVLNTPFLILLDKSGYYLRAGDDWFTAKELEAEWKVAPSPPKAVVDAGNKLRPEAGSGDEAVPKLDKKARIIVVTEPTELISMDGEPKYTPIAGTGLLALSNTETRIFIVIATQKHYLSLNGRWFEAKKIAGPYTYVEAANLPSGFAKIPEGSKYADVRTFVPGTDEAKDAVADTYIPQTAAVDRKKTISVQYAGKPEFKPIEGTKLLYARNTAFRVILAEDQKFYCCHDAVWYVADRAEGPWSVATKVPASIYKIPASAPVYNVTYVRIYGSTPTVVYVGYTPGYVGCYVSGTTIVYGTGYVYPAYVSRVYYYPYPVTYGYPVCYRPYTGWSFVAGFAAGAWVSRRWGGWYGGYRHANVNININKNLNIYNRPTQRPGNRPGQRPTNRPTNRPANRPANRPVNTDARRRPSNNRATTGRNNVYADRNGRVHRRDSNGTWQTRQNSTWQRSSNRAGTQNLNRQASNRQRGTSRARSFGGSRGGGARAGGGRR